MESNRRKRTWRRAGWGALMVLCVLILAAAVALWLGPPRDPKSFALDDEDFGLGFRVGDPWDPDAFEAAMKKNGFVLKKAPDYPAKDEYSFFSAFWTSTDGYLYIYCSSDDKLTTARVETIGISCRRPKELRNEAKERFPDDAYKRELFALDRQRSETARRYPHVRTTEGISLCSTSGQVIDSYGKPLLTIPFGTEDSPILIYYGNHQWSAFHFISDHLTMFTLNPGYKQHGVTARARSWWKYITRPLLLRQLEKTMHGIDAEDNTTDIPVEGSG